MEGSAENNGKTKAKSSFPPEARDVENDGIFDEISHSERLNGVRRVAEIQDTNLQS